MKRKYETRITNHEPRRKGSALILTVVLTTLLATLGVLFVLISRIDKMAASAMSENRQLNFAIDTVVAKISQELVLDVPGIVGQEYYDYPGQEDRWLASLEPNVDDKGTTRTDDDTYYWPQISDVYNKLVSNLQLQAVIVPDYQDAKIMGEGQIADADGDGVADSLWVVIPDVNSSKGRPIYATVRIIDNGGILNINTAYKFDPCEPLNRIDGSNQMQINLLALAARGSTPNPLVKLDNARFGSEPHVLDNYIYDVVWRYNSPNGAYTPFDISDELELRNRFLINLPDTETRIENVWTNAFKNLNLRTPVPWDNSATVRQINLTDWFYRAQHDTTGPNDIYSYKHLATTCNMDRVINPNGSKMLNVNTASAQELCTVLEKIINPGWAAQIAVNLIDSRDSNDNDNVTSFDPAPPGGQIYYGFERPCIYISELDYNQVTITTGSPPVSTTYKSYAVELYKPYSEDAIPGAGLWQLAIDGKPIGIDPWQGKDFYIVQNQDPNGIATITVNQQNAIVRNSNVLVLAANRNIELQRRVTEPNGASKYFTVDSRQVPVSLVLGDGLRSRQRDITKHKCIRRLWDSSTRTPTPGSANSYVDNSRMELVQAHPANRRFTNIGEIGMLFVKSAYSQGPNPIVSGDTEFAVCLNLADSALPFQQLFNYLTVFDPAVYAWNDPNETRIKGRININTAPWFVIAQLPWMQPQIARAIVSYRDMAAKGFSNISKLMNVAEMDYYAVAPSELGDLTRFPDLTPNDGAPDDFEERDAIFARISNLVTVRSDVFTAYILVRIGANGPQKRVLAILDRSQVSSPAGKVKIIALQPVPDPR